MAEKRLKVTGYISYPEGGELPALGDIVHAKIVGEVTEDGTKRTKKANGDITTTITHTATMDSDKCSVTKVLPAEDGQEQLVNV